MAIITISRQFGSLGDEIAKGVADKLNFDYIDKSRISEALANQGIRAPDVEKYDEKKPSIWQSLSDQRKKFVFLIRAVVYDFAMRENVVIVGRGGQVLLKNLPGTFHIRIIAPFETRMKRIMEQEGYDEKNTEKIIRQRDRDSSGYISSFFEADWDDQSLYDLVLNTRTMSVDTGIRLIIEAVGAPEFKEKASEAAEKLGDLALTQKVEAALVEISGLDLTYLYVEKGVANFKGVVNSVETIEECKRVASKIKGIKDVDSQLVVKKTSI
jgi:cytidylate kinase